MNKQLLVTILAVGVLVLGGGSCQNYQTDQSSTLTTSTPEVGTTTSLIDRPVSEWPRYEFKELNFSIQLPFPEKRIVYNYNDCSRAMKDGCDDTNMAQYWGSLKGSTETNEGYSFLGTNSFNYTYGRGATILDIGDIVEGKDPKILLPGTTPDTGTLIHPLQTIKVNTTPIYLFNAYKDFYPDEQFNNIVEYAFVFKLPFQKNFRAVLLKFKPEDIPLEMLPSVIKTIKFNPKDYWANR
jgi:hypothetical protein